MAPLNPNLTAMPHDGRVEAILNRLPGKYLLALYNRYAALAGRETVSRFETKPRAIVRIVDILTRTNRVVVLAALENQAEEVMADANDNPTKDNETPMDTTNPTSAPVPEGLDAVAAKAAKIAEREAAKAAKAAERDAAKVAKAAAKAAKAAKAAAEPTESASKRTLPPLQALPAGFKVDKKMAITLNTDENPLREGSKMFPLFGTYITGQTVAEAYVNGLSAADIRYHVMRGWISVELPAPEAKPAEAA